MGNFYRRRALDELAKAEAFREEKRQKWINDWAGDDAELRAELESKSYAELVCMKHTNPSLPGME